MRRRLRWEYSEAQLRRAVCKPGVSAEITPAGPAARYICYPVPGQSTTLTEAAGWGTERGQVIGAAKRAA